MKTLILYTSLYGATRECAEELAKLLGEADLLAVGKKVRPDFSAYDSVIVGGPVYMNSLPKPMKQFLDEWEPELLEKRLGLFLCCANPKRFERYLPYCFSFEMLDKAEVKECFGGRIDEKKLKFLHKLVIKAVRKQASTPPPESAILHENIRAFAARWKGDPLPETDPKGPQAKPEEDPGPDA